MSCLASKCAEPDKPWFSRREVGMLLEESDAQRPGREAIRNERQQSKAGLTIDML